MRCGCRKSTIAFIIWIMLCRMALDIADTANVCPPIVSRSQWHAESSTCTSYQIIPVSYVIVLATMSLANCTNFAECRSLMRIFQRFYMNEANMCDIPFTFVIADDGLVYEGVGWHRIGSHTFGYDADTIGVAFIGKFTDNLPSRAALESFRDLLDCGVAMGELSEDYAIYAKRQYMPLSENPGAALFRYVKTLDRWSTDLLMPSNEFVQ